MTFLQRTEQIAARFLQTVVVFDDEAYLQVQEDEPPNGTALVEPGPRGGRSSSSETSDEEALSANRHQLNAKRLIDSFAAQGQVCTVLAPAKGEDLVDKVVECGRNADVLVLDWQIAKDDGASAVRVLKQVLEEDQARGGRLRLVVIYTGEPSLENCLETVQRKLDRLARLSQNEFVLGTESARVVFLMKADGDETPNAAVSEHDLPRRIVSEFAKFAGGLLPNAVMTAAAVVRENVHVLLRRFGRELDGAYLGHRVLLPRPADAEAFLFDLVGDEIKSLFDSPFVAEKVVGMGTLSEYVTECFDENTLFLKASKDSGNEQTIAASPANVVEVLEAGTKAIDPSWRWGKVKHLFERVHPLFHKTIPDGKRSYEAFACLSSFRREAVGSDFSDAFEPILLLGAVLADAGGDYFVCLQPVCDCVRLESESLRSFLLGRMERSEREFDLIVREAEDNVRLRFTAKSYHVLSVPFNPGERSEIVGRRIDGCFWFKAADGRAFRWLGDLRRLVAQRFTLRLTEQISRIGLDEFEWQRLHARSGDA